ncbi:MAG: hypothetical protein KIT68_10430 [Phycisphaeraceae bacterium]|nr:hypothetical protein [Phycisphaeraceae bacterium]
MPADRTVEPLTPESYAAMRHWLPRLEARAMGRQIVRPSDPARPGVVFIPMLEQSPDVQAFTQVLYELGWVVSFNWPAWQGTPRAKQLFDEPGTIESASALELRLMITAVVRAERFCEGAVHGSIDSGLFGRIARRAAELSSGPNPPDPGLPPPNFEFA